MRLEFYPEIKLKNEIKQVVSRYLDIKEWKVFFFGSRVSGNNFTSSDIDIGIEGNKEVKPSIMFAIKEELEKIPTLYTFDVIDFASMDEEFKQEAKQNIEYI